MAKNTNPVLDAFRIYGYDPYDVYSSVVEAHFQICFTLLRYDAHIPADWEFSAGAFVPEEDDNDPEKEDAENGEGSLLGWEFDLLMRQGHYSNLIHAGNVLERYAAQLRLAGHGD